MQGLLKWILDHVQVAKVECAIGMWPPQLFFIEEDWMKHLMIAYFNGWMEYKDSLLRRFFEKADAKLRGQAAEFMTTGFGDLPGDINHDGTVDLPDFSEMAKCWLSPRTEL
jgi:hypothetical protein